MDDNEQTETNNGIALMLTSSLCLCCYLSDAGATYNLFLLVQTILHLGEGDDPFAPTACRIQYFYVIAYVVGNSFISTFMSLMGQRAMVVGANFSKRQEQMGAVIATIICLVVATLSAVWADDTQSLEDHAFCFPHGGNKWIAALWAACLIFSTGMLLRFYYSLYKQIKSSAANMARINAILVPALEQESSKTLPISTPEPTMPPLSPTSSFTIADKSNISNLTRSTTEVEASSYARSPMAGSHMSFTIPVHSSDPITPPVDTSIAVAGSQLSRGVSVGSGGGSILRDTAESDRNNNSKRRRRYVYIAVRAAFMLTARAGGTFPILTVSAYIWACVPVPDALINVMSHGISYAPLLHAFVYLMLFPAYKKRILSMLPGQCSTVASEGAFDRRPSAVVTSPIKRGSYKGVVIAVQPGPSSSSVDNNAP